MSVIINTPGLDKLASEKAHLDRQEEFAMRVAFVTRQYVPREEGDLRASEQLSSRYRAGLLVWATPYAAKQYYVPMNHTTPGTTDHWDEAVRRNDMEYIKAYAETLFKE